MRAICILERGNTMANSLVEKRSARARISRTSASVTAARELFSLLSWINLRTFLRYFMLHLIGYRLRFAHYRANLRFLASIKGQSTHRECYYGCHVFANSIKDLARVRTLKHPYHPTIFNLSLCAPIVPYMFLFYARVCIYRVKRSLISRGAMGALGAATFFQSCRVGGLWRCA